MSREIKFRAFHTGSKKMYKPKELLISFDESNDIRIATAEKRNIEYYGYRPRKNTVMVLMQYTGLKDSEGKEIYEGDILFNEADKYNYAIEWNDFAGCWQLGGGGYPITKYQLYEFWKVIGNIYENKELLEGTK